MSGKIKRRGSAVASASDIFGGITGFGTVPGEPQLNEALVLLCEIHCADDTFEGGLGWQRGETEV
jgi:hypothetical protein